MPLNAADLSPADLDAARCLARAEPVNAFALLGPHAQGEGLSVRAFLPGAQALTLIDRDSGAALATMTASAVDGLFVGTLAAPQAYCLRIQWPDAVQETEDAYAFGLLLGELDLHLFAEGRHRALDRCFGAQPLTIDGIRGVRFALWAPNARAVSVVGAFNGWDGRRHRLRQRLEAGVWEIFVPRLRPGERYQYELIGADGARLRKADPYALQTDAPPGTASVVADVPALARDDDKRWRAQRAARNRDGAPLSIYELHAGSWQQGADDWDALAARLVPYVAASGFTHIELLPIMEHPFGGSWGYQPLALYAPTARLGTPKAFARFVDACHGANIGVILDWVPAHFPADAHGLSRFDGSALYEHEDPREGFHPDWQTLIYNLSRHEVRGFLIGSALLWLERYRLDGLRVDAVASMLYRDYSRRAGEWRPNVHGGRENLEAVAFLRELNNVIAERCPGAIVIAEESTAWPGVTEATAQGGLGFRYKWNMGWMHDTLGYLAREPVHRRHHHGDITFGLTYAFSERYVLPLSHDEVVHLKRALVAKFPGDEAQRLATLRAYYGFMWGYPGKKLLFMGGEFAQTREWNHDAELDWNLLDDARHRGVQRLVGDLNRLYRAEAALHRGDCDSRGFRWVVVDDAAQSVFAWLRLDPESAAAPLLVVSNFTPETRVGYRLGVPCAGAWREVFNSDSAHYGGGNVGNLGRLVADAQASHGQPATLSLTLPPLATVILRPDDERAESAHGR